MLSILKKILLEIFSCFVLLVLLQVMYMLIQPGIDRKYCSKYISKINEYHEVHGVYPESINEIEKPPPVTSGMN